SLAVMIFLILKILIPYMLKGYSPIMLSVVVTVISTVITFLLVGGVTIKSLSAIIGTAGGVLIAAGIAVIVGKLARLTGLGVEEARMLMYIPQGIEFDFQGLLFAGIIIGSLGAVMDVSMSIASSMDEVKHANPDIATNDLIKSGMNVGRDIMGTMSNTLILAYTGASIPLLLLLSAYENTLSSVLNFDFITTEIVRSLAGSIGLIVTIPLTAFITGFLEKLQSGNQ
ncbi:MAG: YibE/F family protein, partial [Bacillota bacterium]|nr:YibE/F family protein [Bacillota bacterium]